jgi:hypothetical protein
LLTVGGARKNALFQRFSGRINRNPGGGTRIAPFSAVQGWTAEVKGLIQGFDHGRKRTQREQIMGTRYGMKSGWVCAAAIAAALLASLTASRAEAQIGLYEVARFNLNSTSGTANPQFIGSNPIAVGWNGSKLYVAGFNGSGVTTNTSIVEITNAAAGVTAGGFVTPTYSSTFGTISTVTTRGYTGLSMKGNQLAASYDAGSNSPNGIQMFNASTNTQSWNLSASGTNTANIGTTRGFAGPDFDPGYLGVSGSGSGLAWVTQGQGRRFLNDESTGAAIYTTTAGVPAGAAQGMIINTNPTSTNWRDIAFDPATGDMYTRVNNNVSRTNRTGSNTDADPITSTAGQSAVIVTLTTAGNNVGTSINYMNSIAASSINSFSNTYAGDLLVFNDRSSTAAGQSWTNVIKFTTTSGSSITPSWTFLSTPSTGVAAYDFEWDSATQTLAVVDYTNRNVSIFSTAVPEPSTWAMLVIGGAVSGFAALRRRLRRQG